MCPLGNEQAIELCTSDPQFICLIVGKPCAAFVLSCRCLVAVPRFVEALFVSVGKVVVNISRVNSAMLRN